MQFMDVMAPLAALSSSGSGVSSSCSGSGNSSSGVNDRSTVTSPSLYSIALLTVDAFQYELYYIK